MASDKILRQLDKQWTDSNMVNSHSSIILNLKKYSSRKEDPDEGRRLEP